MSRRPLESPRLHLGCAWHNYDGLSWRAATPNCLSLNSIYPVMTLIINLIKRRDLFPQFGTIFGGGQDAPLPHIFNVAFSCRRT